MLKKLNCTILSFYLLIQKGNRTYDLINLKLLSMKMTMIVKSNAYNDNISLCGKRVWFHRFENRKTSF
ncbi:unnamed protein product [Coffea canephora]|uniref:Uncharacterized protein n=1 Tax=Coffea canephora TaxID=49390 RepID=A0A068U936_COFCA|nr:unnamed protein product [Coffea canephora]